MHRAAELTHIAFIMGEIGVLKLPLNILEEYILQANTSPKPDGTIKHYHLFIRTKPKVELYTNQNKKIWDVDEYFHSGD